MHSQQVGQHREAEVPSIPDFESAEAAAAEVIDAVLEGGGQYLYDLYLEGKSVPYAATAATDMLTAGVHMCFVSHDQGEQAADIEDWTLEKEPQRCQIDTWARGVVPIRKKVTQPKSDTADEKRRGIMRRTTRLGSTASSHLSSRANMHALGSTMEVNPDRPDAKVANQKPQVLPLVVTREEDEEEAFWRDLQESKQRRKREEEARMERKVQLEAEEISKIAQVRDQAKNKPFTYDSEGNVIWVKNFNAEKALPAFNPVPDFTVRNDQQDDPPYPSRPQPFRKRPQRSSVLSSRTPRKKEEVNPENFIKRISQQPAMMETMEVAPGVVLEERGRQKRGEEPAPSASPRTVSRREYLLLVERGGFRAGGSPIAGNPHETGRRELQPV